MRLPRRYGATSPSPGPPGHPLPEGEGPDSSGCALESTMWSTHLAQVRLRTRALTRQVREVVRNAVKHTSHNQACFFKDILKLVFVEHNFNYPLSVGPLLQQGGLAMRMNRYGVKNNEASGDAPA